MSLCCQAVAELTREKEAYKVRVVEAEAVAKQSKQTVKPTSKPLTTKQPAGKQATTKTQKVTDKTKTLTRKSRKNV